MDAEYVEIRVRVNLPLYRHLYAEAQRRALAGGVGELLGMMINRQPPPRRRPGNNPQTRIPAETRAATLKRIAEGEVSVRRAAAELGVTRAAIHGWQRNARAVEHEAHAAQLEALGVAGRAPVPHPAVPSLDA